MLNLTCNIDKTERFNRIVFGVIIALGNFIHLGRWFFWLIALILIVEGAIGWCGIPVARAKIEEYFRKSKK